jgi:hypothetical protein
VLETECAADAWVAEHGGNFSFLIAAHMTFSRVYDDFFDDPVDDSSQLVMTAGRRLLDAAHALSAAGPVPDVAAQQLLTDILQRVHRMVGLALAGERSIELVRLKSRTDADLVQLADRLRALA